MKNNSNIENQYLDLLSDIMGNGSTKLDRTGTGTLSVFGREIRHNMTDGFPLLTTKQMYFKGIVTELLWFLRGDTNIKYLLDNNCHIWDGDVYKSYEQSLKDTEQDVLSKDVFIQKIKTDSKFAKKFGDVGKIYGKQWRRWGSEGGDIDQIQLLITNLRINPDSRRLIVSAWNVADLQNMVLPPYHYVFQLYTRELPREERIRLYITNYTDSDEVSLENLTDDALSENNIPQRAISLKWEQRSVDVPLGLPFNIASYALLLMILGRMCNMVPEELIGSLGDTHIYLNQINGAKEQITRNPFPLPNVEFANDINFNGTIDDFLKSCTQDKIDLINYNHHPKIDYPLSN